ncbi:hypothetical protein AYI68_g2362 [Smittium mucronatum]|uniref:Uncharacterized protein n=1 Tax=Smittium mucronatum TaxID=133383 RepID=A0A1R0H2Y9_9FUNG|nr:hypothetical protein AYI68_g2362 [Smittium mucronatum]
MYNSAMGNVMLNHDLTESGAYPNGFAPEVDAWIEMAEFSDIDASVSVSNEAPALGIDLDPYFNYMEEPVMEDLISS